MKKIVLLFLGLLVWFSGFSQTETSYEDRFYRRGYRRLHRLAYVDAYRDFKKSYEHTKSNEALRWMGYSALYANMYEQSIRAFGALYTTRNVPFEDVFAYARVLKATGRYDEAKRVLRELLRLQPDNKYVRNIYKGCDLATQLMAKPAPYYIQPFEYNTEYNENMPFWFNGKLIYCSNRLYKKSKEVYQWDEQAVTDLVIVSLDSSEKKGPSLFSKELQSDEHDGPIVISQDSSIAIICYNRSELSAFKFRDVSTDAQFIALYESRMVKGKWSKPRILPFCKPNFSYAHPSLNSKGDVLYFTSNDTSGFGKKDIWMSHWNGKEWGDPINLGPTINTEGNEKTPYLFNDTLLYFASDFHPGLGDYDLFFSTKKGDYFSKPINIGYPLNSAQEDFGICFLPDGERGFLSSQRKGKGGDDLFFFTKVECEVRGLVLDSITYEPMPGVRIRVDDGDRQVYTGYTDENGNFKVKINPKNQSFVNVIAAGYAPRRISVNCGNLASMDPKKPNLIVELSRGNSRKIRGIVLEKTSRASIDLADVTISGYGNTLDRLRSDGYGQFESILSNPGTVNFTAAKEGYLKSGTRINYQVPGFNEDSVIVIELEKIEKNKTISLEPIFYDLDKSEIRSDAAKTLDKLVILMKENPNISIELSSHTDSRASDEYNVALSERRALAAIEYLTQRGIDRFRLSFKWYGKRKMAVPCNDDCPEAEHQKNRRTEFRVTDF